MDDKRRDTGSPSPALTLSGGSSAKSGESPAPEPSAPRRRGLKRKSTASITSSAPPKRHVREKAAAAAAAAASAAIGLSSLLSPFHNGPLTRARQLSDTNAVLNAVKEETAIAALRDSSGGDGGKVIENCNEEFKAIQASVEAEFDAIRSRHVNSHVVPVAAGWFSWTKLHPLEKQALPSFFNGESENRTPEVYMEIRNWIMKRFHANPNTNIGLKDLSALSTGDSDARQEVLEFLDYWGLINYHPFPKNDTANTDVGPNIDDDKTENTNPSIENLFQFENELSFPELLPRANAVQTRPSGLLRESAIAEEFMRQEEPAVEYHCNSCSADCSRKRYHCQKQADFDLCTDCFNNEKFGSGMSSSDFILMEPGEASSASGGKWTDQETLLLLEALELFKENWNEIAEHVATKTKAQCILHFLQMPIEDGFLDYDDDTKAGIKEMAEPTLMGDDATVRKDNLEPSEDKMGEGNPDQIGSGSGMENSEPSATESAKADPEPTERKSDIDAAQPASTTIDTSKEETQDGKLTQEKGDSVILKALMDAFDAVGWPVTPQDNLCFAEAGNSVMALAAFLTQLVEPNLAMASAHSSIKATTENSPGAQLAARHCFVLEDPPDDDTEHIISESIATENSDQNATKVVTEEGENDKEITPNEGNLTKVDDDNPSTLLNGRHSVDDLTVNKKGSHPGESQGLISVDQSVLKDKHKVMKKLDKKKAKVVKKPNEALQVSRKAPGKRSNKDKSQDAEELEEDKSQVEEKQTETTSTGQAGPNIDQSRPDKQDDSSSKAQLFPTSNDGSGNVHVASEVGQCIDNAGGISMGSSSVVSEQMEQQETLLSDPVARVEAVTVEDKMQFDDIEELKPLKTARVVDDDSVAKLKRAALATLSAAAVKAKLLAEQEEDEIKQLATVLIEKQLRKLEIKLSFFTEMEGSILRVRELLERSKQRVSAERSMLIASRLGNQGGGGRGMGGSSHPLNRLPPGLLNRMNTAAQRPPMGRPVMATMNTVGPQEGRGYGGGQSMGEEKPC